MCAMKSPLHSAMFVIQIISDIKIIVQNRLQAVFGYVAVHFFKASSVVYLELFVSLCAVRFLSGILAFMIADSR